MAFGVYSPSPIHLKKFIVMNRLTALDSLKVVNKLDGVKKAKFYHIEPVNELIEKLFDRIDHYKLEIENMNQLEKLEAVEERTVSKEGFEMPPDKMILDRWDDMQKFYDQLLARYNFLKGKGSEIKEKGEQIVQKNSLHNLILGFKK